MNIYEFKQLRIQDANLIRDPLTIPDNTPYKTAIEKIKKDNQKFAIVTDSDDNRKINGIISIFDILKSFNSTDRDDNITIRPYVIDKEKVIAIKPNQTMDDLRKKIAESKKEIIPVVKDDGTWVGIISAADVRKKLAEEVTLEF